MSVANKIIATARFWRDGLIPSYINGVRSRSALCAGVRDDDLFLVEDGNVRIGVIHFDVNYLALEGVYNARSRNTYGAIVPNRLISCLNEVALVCCIIHVSYLSHFKIVVSYGVICAVVLIELLNHRVRDVAVSLWGELSTPDEILKCRR